MDKLNTRIAYKEIMYQYTTLVRLDNYFSDNYLSYNIKILRQPTNHDRMKISRLIAFES